MKRRIKASVVFDTPAKRNNFNTRFSDIILGKSLFEKSDVNSEDKETGKPTKDIDTRFNIPAEADDAFAKIKIALENTPWLKGTVSIHNCNHDVKAWDCRSDSRAEYQEFVK